MIPLFKDYLLKNWAKIGLSREPKNLLFIKFADRRIRAAEVGIISFLIKDGQKALMILRTPRYPTNEEANRSLELEYANLSSLSEKLPGSTLLAQIPRLLIWEKFDKIRVLGISFLAGADLSQYMSSADILKSYIDNFSLMLSWLVNFQQEVGAEQTVPLGTIVERVYDEYRTLFPDKIALADAYFSSCQPDLARFKEQMIPLFAQHGDFHAQNIFALKGRVSGVIDWEDFELLGVPGFDLFHFIKTYFEGLFGYFADKNDVMALHQFSSQVSQQVVKVTSDSYFSKMRLDPELVKILVPLYLLKSAVLAGEPRKKATAAVTRLEILLRLKPLNLEELVYFSSLFSYGDIYKKATAEQNAQLAEICRNEIQQIQLKTKGR